MTTVEVALAQARAHHNAGRMQDAEALYRQIVAADPKSFEAHYLLGATCHALGKIDDAVANLERALALDPTRAEAQHHLGLLLAQQGRLDQAVERLQVACRLAPQAAAMQEHLGQVLAVRDRQLAHALTQQGRLDEAAACYRRILERDPNDTGANNNLGILLQQQSRFDLAEACYRKVLAMNPHDAGALNNLGSALHRQDKLAEAETCLRQAMALNPNDMGAYRNLAPVLHSQDRFEEAAACYRRVLELVPDHADSLYDLGVVLHKLQKIDEALACYRRAIELDPGNADAHNNLGTLWADQRETDQVLACYRRAIELRPDHADAHYNLALVLLLTGNLADGWREYEWRWKVKESRGAPLAQPRWNGESLPTGTILLRGEQGMGDMLQFVRYATLVKQHVGRVVVECHAPLTRLLASCPGVDHVIAIDQPLGEFDVHLPIMSLPYVFGTRMENIPAQVPYLWPDAELVEHWKHELDEPGIFKVGIAWQGNPSHGRDRFRSIPLANYVGIPRVPDVRVYSLQLGAGREQLANLDAGVAIEDLGDRLGEFHNTAAIMRNLDLVISCDSSPAHLAGALGVPVRVALAAAPDWRWLLGRSDNPWYPTMRLFRQAAPGDWGDVFREIVTELTKLAKRERA